ncbi:MAG: hypothetical protein KAG37_11900, partial [Flavobacteriales bacterium]|nr:hypothetical protein [Flavobacteriales bacterium]
MKNTIILIAILVSSLSMVAQDITNTLGPDGYYVIENSAGNHVPFVANSIGQVGLSMDRTEKEGDMLTSSVNI